MEQQVQEAQARLGQEWQHAAQVAVILGSGLGGVVDALSVDQSIPYEEIPHFPRSTAIGHAGRLVLGKLSGQPVIVLQGRCHLYEGHHWDHVTFPIRLLKSLGVSTLVLSCAAGGLSPELKVGDLLMIDDHLNFNMHSGRTPDWVTAKEGWRSPFCQERQRILKEVAAEGGISLSQGTYIGVAGPNYETGSEQRMFSRWGDAVGMSTIPEALLARHLGMNTVAIATITNLCRPDDVQVVDGHNVLAAAQAVEPKFRELLSRFLTACNTR